MPDRHGRDSAERRRTSGADSIVAAGTLLTEGMNRAAAVAGDGQPRQGEAAADRRRSRDIRQYADNYVGYRLDYIECDSS